MIRLTLHTAFTELLTDIGVVNMYVRMISFLSSTLPTNGRLLELIWHLEGSIRICTSLASCQHSVDGISAIELLNVSEHRIDFTEILKMLPDMGVSEHVRTSRHNVSQCSPCTVNSAYCVHCTINTLRPRSPVVTNTHHPSYPHSRITLMCVHSAHTLYI